MIDSTSPLDRASRAASVPDEAASPGSARALRIRDSLQTNNAAQLNAALGGQPEIRPDVVARGRALAADPGYPGAAVLGSVASVIVNSPDPTEDQS
jgi:hypothetical protein